MVSAPSTQSEASLYNSNPKNFTAMLFPSDGDIDLFALSAYSAGLFAAQP
jgi:hypothetical protein